MKQVLVWFVCASAALAAPAAAILCTIGKQGVVVPYPFRGNAGVNAVRCQDLVLASELKPSKANPVIEIVQWEWFASETISVGFFHNFTIKLCHTDRTALTANFNDNYGRFTPVTVYYLASQYLKPDPKDWFGLRFTKKFYYDGYSNVIVEVEWRGDTGGYTYTYRSAATARCVFNYNGGTPAVRNYVHYMRVTIHYIPGVEPTSLGRVRALYL
jgi:hypothetical protein